MGRTGDELTMCDVPPVLKLAAAIVWQAATDAHKGDTAARTWLLLDDDGLLAWITPPDADPLTVARRLLKGSPPMIGEHLTQLSDAEFQALYNALYGSSAPDKESAAVSAWYDVLRAIADDEHDRRIGTTRRVLTDYEPLLCRAARGLDDDQLAVLTAATMVITRGMTKIPADHPFVKHEGQLLGILQGEFTRRQMVGV